jgi:hypothetical protein
MGLSAWRRIRLRERVLLGLLPALVFRALIPVGFMPSTGTAFALELCASAGYGAVFQEYDPAASPEGHTGGTFPAHEPCAFAASATPGPAPAAAVVVAAAPGEAPVALLPAPSLPARPSLTPPPRAPPHLA